MDANNTVAPATWRGGDDDSSSDLSSSSSGSASDSPTSSVDNNGVGNEVQDEEDSAAASSSSSLAPSSGSGDDDDSSSAMGIAEHVEQEVRDLLVAAAAAKDEAADDNKGGGDDNKADDIKALLAVVDAEDDDAVLRAGRQALRTAEDDEGEAVFTDSSDDADDSDSPRQGGKRAHAPRQAKSKRLCSGATNDAAAAAVANIEYAKLASSLATGKPASTDNHNTNNDDDDSDSDGNAHSSGDDSCVSKDSLEPDERIRRQIACGLCDELPVFRLPMFTKLYAVTARDDYVTLERRPDSTVSSHVNYGNDANNTCLLLIDLRDEERVSEKLNDFLDKTDTLETQLAAAGATTSKMATAPLVFQDGGMDADDDDSDAAPPPKQPAPLECEPEHIVQALWFAINALTDDDIDRESQLAMWASDMKVPRDGWIRRGPDDSDIVILVSRKVHSKWAALDDSTATVQPSVSASSSSSSDSQ